VNENQPWTAVDLGEFGLELFGCTYASRRDEERFLGRQSLRLQLDDRVADVRFNGKGCAISQASASILTEEIKGKTLDEIKAIDRDHILENLGIPISPARIKCALLSLKTLKGAAWGLPAWPDEDEAKARSAGQGR